jgi:hypothetical protein
MKPTLPTTPALTRPLPILDLTCHNSQPRYPRLLPTMRPQHITEVIFEELNAGFQTLKLYGAIAYTLDLRKSTNNLADYS